MLKTIFLLVAVVLVHVVAKTIADVETKMARAEAAPKTSQLAGVMPRELGR